LRVDNDLTPQQRAAMVACWLYSGEELTVCQVAERCGIKPRAALKLLCVLSQKLPMQNGEEGDGLVWKWCDKR
jgi:hypothetical protein